jgi:GTP-binding protein
VPEQRQDLRNVAIIAHVDHGKTTLVDAMLWQSGAFRANQDVNERVMDSMDLEREKGITILAKNTAVPYGDVKLNIVDTPGHADFGGEVERGLSMVDASRCSWTPPRARCRRPASCCARRSPRDMPVILIINKVDRPDARIAEVVDECYELFLDLDADEQQIDFPIVYCQRKTGQASLTRPADGTSRTALTSRPLFQVIKDTIPAPTYVEGAPLQAHVTNLDASPYLGRLALCRIFTGR